MDEEEKPTRRALLRGAASLTAGGFLGWATYKKPLPKPKPELSEKKPASPSRNPESPKQPPIEDVMPDILNPKKRSGRTAAGAVTTWAVVEGGRRVLFGRKPPADVTWRQRQAEEEREAGRQWAWWHRDDGRNPNDPRER